MEKIYKAIKGYEDKYLISNAGNIYSLTKNKILTEKIDKEGYYFIVFVVNNNKKYFRISRLVAEHFLLEAHTKETVNHKDFDKSNNWFWNLEWATNLENIAHAVRNGRMRGGSKKKLCGDSKICRGCKREKKLIEFNKGKGIGGYNPRCIDCERERLKLYYKENREKFLIKYLPKKARYKNTKYKL